MPAKNLTPAQLVAKRFGTAYRLSKLMGGSPTLVKGWEYRGGSIPNGNSNENHAKIMRLAKEHGVKLTEKELIYGGY